MNLFYKNELSLKIFLAFNALILLMLKLFFNSTKNKIQKKQF